MTIKILAVVGGRDYTQQARLFKEIDAMRQKHPEIDTIVSGDCPTGTDFLAKKYAQINKLRYIGVPADWKDMTQPCIRRYRHDGTSYNALAGPKRNSLIVQHCDGVLASPGGTGTADVVTKADKAGKLLKQFK